MNDKALSNDFDARIKTVIQHMMCNLVSSDSSANTISSSIFKLEEIRYYNLKLDIQYDKEDIVTVEKNSYIQDMHLFINQIKNVTVIKKADQIKIQLFRALKKIALK